MAKRARKTKKQQYQQEHSQDKIVQLNAHRKRHVQIVPRNLAQEDYVELLDDEKRNIVFVKKFKVYVKDPKTGNTKKVNFGHGGSSVKGKAMKIKKNNPGRRKSFRARHNCDNPGPRTKARYWSCRKW